MSHRRALLGRQALDKAEEMLLDALGFEAATFEFLVARTQLFGRVRGAHAADTRTRVACCGAPGTAVKPNMTTGSVLDILIYVFDRYMLDAAPEVPQREQLAQALEHAGFSPAKVERALDWLSDLAFGHLQAAGGDLAALPPTLRVFTDSEQARLGRESRGLLLQLERARVLSPQQREIVIERMLALDTEEPDSEQLKWVVLMVLSSQPGQEHAVERLGRLVADEHFNAPH
jgi:Smg protein